MSRATAVQLAFIKKEKITESIYSYYFNIKWTNFIFLPGQYIQITIPHLTPDDRGTSRFFTIASSPTEKDYLMITSRKGVSSFKKALFQLQPGTAVQFFGPIGTFVLEES